VAQDNLGQAVYLKGRFSEAIAHFEKALFIEPNEAIAHGALGAVLLKVGRRQEAFEHLQKSLEINPQQASVHSTLGAALLAENKPNESLAHLQAALVINSEDGDAHYNLANTLLQLGRPKEALTEYERALRINPIDPETLNNMAWMLATWPDASVRDGIRAVELAEKGDELTQRRSSVLCATLAAAYAESGRFGDAVKTGERALQLALGEGNSARAAFIGAQIDMFRSNAAFRDRRYSPAGQ
jgi:Flp pilus assembly protein TadD